jgi:hypothetical protein
MRGELTGRIGLCDVISIIGLLQRLPDARLKRL